MRKQGTGESYIIRSFIMCTVIQYCKCDCVKKYEMKEHERFFSEPSTCNDLAVTENDRFLKGVITIVLPYIPGSKNGIERLILRVF
jgi:hypothetical protein